MSSQDDAAHQRQKKRKLLLSAIISHSLLSNSPISSLPALSSLIIRSPTPAISSSLNLSLYFEFTAVASALLNTTTGCTSPHPDQGGQRINTLYLLQKGIGYCLWAFGFTCPELVRLSVVMDILSPLKTCSSYSATALEALAILCAHLRCEGSQWTLVTRYAHSQSAISEIIAEVIKYIDRRWKFLLEWDTNGVVHPRYLQEYARMFQHFGAPCDTIFGFIDCTIRATCHPGRLQELAYTGYKKRHGMKFQAVAIPNGLIAHLSGPYQAPQNDSGVLNKSKLLDTLEQHAIQPGSHPTDPPQQRYFQVYGDSAYKLGPCILSPFSEGREPLTVE